MGTYARGRLGGEPTKHSRPRLFPNVLLESGKRLIVLAAVIVKVQAYPTPKNVKEVQDFVEILEF